MPLTTKITSWQWPVNQQEEDCLDLITALLELNCFVKTTAATRHIPKQSLMIAWLLYAPYHLIKTNCIIAPSLLDDVMFLIWKFARNIEWYKKETSIMLLITLLINIFLPQKWKINLFVLWVKVGQQCNQASRTIQGLRLPQLILERLCFFPSTASFGKLLFTSRNI